MKNLRRLQFIYLFCHALIPIALLFGTSGWWLYSVFCYLVLQNVGVGIGLHRLIAHKAFPTSPFSFYFLSFVATLSCVGSPLSWAAIHRLHHAHADTARDPHSPQQLGAWGILLGTYNSELRLPPSIAKDLVSSRWLQWLHHRYFTILGVYISLLGVLGWRFFVFQFAMPVVMVYWANALGIFLNHTWGYRNFATSDRSVNSLLLSFYTLGDGWHNNHHHRPGDYAHGVKWWEFDFCALLIKHVFMARSKSRMIQHPRELATLGEERAAPEYGYR